MVKYLKTLLAAAAICLTFASTPLRASSYIGTYTSDDNSVVAHFRIYDTWSEGFRWENPIRAVRGDINGDIIKIIPSPLYPEPDGTSILSGFVDRTGRQGYADYKGPVNYFEFALQDSSGSQYFVLGNSHGMEILGGTEADHLNLSVGTFEFVSSLAPEPASWAMMIGGFGFVGGALRGRGRGERTRKLRHL
jgi:hypothetical protein